MGVMFKRAMIFATFFSSCLSFVLLLASLLTKEWLVAHAKRLTSSLPLEVNYTKLEFDDRSDGRIQLGLFYMHKELNVAYGWRTNDTSVFDLLINDRELMVYNLWLATIILLIIAIIFVVIAAIFAVINTAITPIYLIFGVPGLYIWNSLAFLTSLGVVVCWLSQYFHKLQFNVMPLEDRLAKWRSDGMTELGYSFWFVIASACISLINVIIVYIGTTEVKSMEPSPSPAVQHIIEEKSNNGIIMLY